MSAHPLKTKLAVLINKIKTRTSNAKNKTLIRIKAAQTSATRINLVRIIYPLQDNCEQAAPERRAAFRIWIIRL